MQRREFLIALSSTVAGGAMLGGCSTSSSVTTSSSDTAASQRRRELDAGVKTTLDRLYASVGGSREVAGKARGMLVFPSVIAAGLGIGGQYGEGALEVNKAIEGYYNLASLSIGLQAGAQSKAIIFMFLTQESLDAFRKSEGWSVGADASVAVLRMGANGQIDASTIKGPVVAFVLTNAGLMANLTLEGTKITRMKS